MNQKIIDGVLKFLVGFLSKKEPSVEVEIPLGSNAPADPKPEAKEEEASKPIGYLSVNWEDQNAKISEHFTVGEALTLHSWNRMGTISDGVTEEVKTNIYALCQVLEKVRNILGCGMNVHCIFRSVEYNSEVLHSLPNDVHSKGMAIDFDCNGNMTIEQVKEKLVPELEALGMRMEKGTTTWVHLDTHSVGPSGRYFTA